MSRKVIKSITNEPEEFIPESMKDLDPNCKDLKDCPMIFVGKRTNRDQQWFIQDMLELKDSANPSKGVKGMGVAFRYMWENIITEVRNVYAVGDVIKGDDKNALWDSNIEEEITEAITHFYTKSKLDEDESKTSV